MTEKVKSFEAWIRFGGFVLVVGVLKWGEVVLVPLCLAILITFVLTPPVTWLQRRIGRGAAVLIVVTLVFSGLGLAAYGVYRQTTSLVEALPEYSRNIRAKIRDVRGAQQGGSVEKLSDTLEQIKGDLGGGPATPRAREPEDHVVVGQSDATATGWLQTFLAPLGTASFVITLVLFMLLDRERLRDRLIGLFGKGRLATTTRAMDEASRRVSRQLLLQTIVNVIYGVIVVGGLYVLGVPYPLFWGVLGAALRFIPYVGPAVAAGAPILLALSALPGWTGPLLVVGFYVALELFTNLVLETVLYADAAGISQVALLVAVAFWTWLWGSLGLLMAVPLTVCIIVVGKHVPGLTFLGTLLSDAPALTVESSYYQRLLARDQADALDLVDKYIKSEELDGVYDALLVPALNYAERDRLEGHLSEDEEAAVVDTTREVLESLADQAPETVSPERGSALRVLGCAVNGTADELALEMLSQLMRGSDVIIDVASARVLSSELVNRVRQGHYALVCIADLPPSPPSKARYLVKRLTTALPEVRVVVGRWAAMELADETLQPLTDAGAAHVGASLRETRRYLIEVTHGASAAAPTAAA